MALRFGWLARTASLGVFVGALCSQTFPCQAEEKSVGAAMAAPPTTVPVSNLPPSPVVAGLEAPVSCNAPCETGCCAGDWPQSAYRFQKFFWPVGYPTNPPTGPGYYSLLDCVLGNYRDTPPKGGYPRIFSTPQCFADVDFRYVEDSNNCPDFFEQLHRIHVTDDLMIGTGGEYRNRYDTENNSRLSGKANTYDLNRLRVFADVWYRDDIRFYAEFIDAQLTPQTLAPLGNDRSYADILNMFVDVKVWSIEGDSVYARLGRQELLFGSQRLISPLDWANTLRTFDGARLYYRTENFDVDVFWAKPVIPNANHELSSSDDHQNLAGLWTTYRPAKDQVLDLYYLYFNNEDSPAVAKANDVGSLTPITAKMKFQTYDVNTLGYRYAANFDGILFDSENILQVGNRGSTDICAGSTTTGLGLNLKDVPLNPTFWAYYDFATGSNTVGGSNTFNQLYPFGHYYLGWMDYVRPAEY